MIDSRIGPAEEGYHEVEDGPMSDRERDSMEIRLVLRRPRFRNADEALRTLMGQKKLLVAMESSSACSRRIGSGA
jgi:hypothetical protein